MELRNNGLFPGSDGFELPMGIETELKLTISLSNLLRVERQAWLRKLANGPARQEKLVSVYFDTAKFKLRNHGVSLRIRKKGGKRIQTIKAAANDDDGAFGRREWETEIAGETPNYKLAEGTALAPLLTPSLKRALQPVFETKIERTTLPVRVGSSLIEVALDRGHIRAGRRRQAISEIELELKAGKPADLARLAQEFACKLPVSYGVHAKAERGYALSADGGGEAVRAADILLASNASAAEALTAIGLSCLHHLARNEEAVLHGAPEGIHQMRVGLRRLRAAISLFKDVVLGPETEKIKVQLKWLTEQLGPARDFDVLVTESMTSLQGASPHTPEIALLQADLRKLRHSGFDRAKSAVRSDRYRKAILQTALWLTNGKWLRNADPRAAGRRNRPIGDYAATIMDGRAKKVTKKIARLRSLNTRQRHKLRIATKKLRYAAEFFECVFLNKQTEAGHKTFEKSLKALQDALGTLNDIAVHEKLAGKYAHPKQRERRRTDKAFAMGMLTGYETIEAKICLAAAVQAGKRLENAPRFWR